MTELVTGSHIVRCQILWFAIEIRYDDPRLDDPLAYLVNHAEQPLEPTASLRLTVIGSGPYDLLADGVATGSADDAMAVLVWAYRSCHERVFAEAAARGWVPLHAGVVSVAGHRLLVMGSKGAGKTTLMLRLHVDGHAVEGDEMALVRDGVVMALPRTWHVKPGSRSVIPVVDAIWSELPRVADEHGSPVAGYDPTLRGLPWVIRAAAVDAAVVLRPDHGGAAGCRPLGATELIQAALANCMETPLAHGAIIGAVTSTLGSVPAFELTVGEISQTAGLILRCATEPAGV